MEDKGKIKLKSLILSGYKSINQDGQTIEFGDVTVLLGANGAGKSNLISFFRFLAFMVNGNTQRYIAKEGFADSLLYLGKKDTSKIRASVYFNAQFLDDNINVDVSYNLLLTSTKDDTLMFDEEYVLFKANEYASVKLDHIEEKKVVIKNNLKESGLSVLETKEVIEGKSFYQLISVLLSTCVLYQFHDTSASSKIRHSGYINNNESLSRDGSNLAAYLYVLKNKFGNYYKRIIRYVKQMMPQFEDFVLNSSPLNENQIFLNWKEIDSDYTMGPHQISDGTLRFMCLTTLLLGPPEKQPRLIIIDEPELGLHPSAISLLAGMIKTASQHCQVLIATQSTRLVDEFEVDDIVVVDRNPKTKSSEFKRLDKDKLSEWLERYSLSELWEKNVFGGKP